MRISRVATSTAIALATTTAAFAQQGNSERYYHGPGMMWHDGYGGGFGMIFGPVIMILILAAIVIGIIWLLRATGALGHSGGAGGGSVDTSNKALDILKERFAKGEIDAKEFDERKRLLSD